MGLIIGKFRKKQTTVEILEGIEKEITKLQRFRRHNQELQKKFIARLILYSIVLYIICAILFYFLYFPDTWRDRFLCSLPLLAFPFLVWGIKKTLHWYFVQRIASNDTSLVELREKKKQILEDVMENETYKKAREILEKFDPARFKQLEKPAQPSPRPQTSQTQGSALRQRVTPRMATPIRPGTPLRPGTPMRPGTPAGTPYLPRTSPQSGPRPGMTMNGQFIQGYGMSPGPPLPRPVPPRERGNFDKFVEYIVGDGPQSRYALICKYCHSHNGMALKEEFEFLSFRCCYCYGMNPARKQRPHAPKLEFPVPPSPQKQQPQSSQQGAAAAADVDDDEDDEYDDEDSEESGSSGSANSQTSNNKDEKIKTEKPEMSSSQTKAEEIKSKSVDLEKDLKFADESEGQTQELAKDKVVDDKQETAVKGELRTE